MEPTCAYTSSIAFYSLEIMKTVSSKAFKLLAKPTYSFGSWTSTQVSIVLFPLHFTFSSSFFSNGFCAFRVRLCILLVFLPLSAAPSLIHALYIPDDLCLGFSSILFLLPFSHLFSSLRHLNFRLFHKQFDKLRRDGIRECLTLNCSAFCRCYTHKVAKLQQLNGLIGTTDLVWPKTLPHR